MEITIPVNTPIFHGSTSDLSQVNPGADGVSWFAQDSRFARSYIKGILNKGQVDRYEPVHAWENLPGFLNDHRRSLSRADLWEIQGPASIVLGDELITATTADAMYTPAIPDGYLYEARSTRDLRIFDAESKLGDSSTITPQHGMLNLFEAAEEAGFDGVKISDHLQSMVWGNFGHSSIGIFPGTKSVQITKQHPVKHFDAHVLSDLVGEDTLFTDRDVLLHAGADGFSYLFQLSEFSHELLLNKARELKADAILEVGSSEPIWCNSLAWELKQSRLKEIESRTGLNLVALAGRGTAAGSPLSAQSGDDESSKLPAASLMMR